MFAIIDDVVDVVKNLLQVFNNGIENVTILTCISAVSSCTVVGSRVGAVGGSVGAVVGRVSAGAIGSCAIASRSIARSISSRVAIFGIICSGICGATISGGIVLRIISGGVCGATVSCSVSGASVSSAVGGGVIFRSAICRVSSVVRGATICGAVSLAIIDSIISRVGGGITSGVSAVASSVSAIGISSGVGGVSGGITSGIAGSISSGIAGVVGSVFSLSIINNCVTSSGIGCISISGSVSGITSGAGGVAISSSVGSVASVSIASRIVVGIVSFSIINNCVTSSGICIIAITSSIGSVAGSIGGVVGLAIVNSSAIRDCTICSSIASRVSITASSVSVATSSVSIATSGIGSISTSVVSTISTSSVGSISSNVFSSIWVRYYWFWLLRWNDIINANVGLRLLVCLEGCGKSVALRLLDIAERGPRGVQSSNVGEWGACALLRRQQGAFPWHAARLRRTAHRSGEALAGEWVQVLLRGTGEVAARWPRIVSQREWVHDCWLPVVRLVR